MTENLLTKLEERMMQLLTEVEDLRRAVTQLTTENNTLRTEKDSHSRKLQDLIGLLDTVNTVTTLSNVTVVNPKPVLVQVEG